MNVKIKIYNFELESMLDRIHFWGSNYDWGGVSGHPNFEIELIVEKDLDDVEQKYIGDRFARDVAHTDTKESLIDLLKEKNIMESSPTLSDFLKGGK